MSALFLCYLRWGAMYDPYTPANVLQGFAKPTKSHFSDALGAPRHLEESKRGREERERVAPETPDSYQNGAQAPCRESVKNEKWKCQKLEGNLASEGKLSINTQENVKSAS